MRELIPDDLAFHAILNRAHAYRVKVYASTGQPPDSFMVTEEDYCLLQLHYGGPAAGDAPGELQLMGMVVHRPERFDWYGDNLSMEHFRRMEPLRLSDPFPPAPLAIERCRTNLPLAPCRDVACPCGEVIWDMSTCTVPRDTGRRLISMPLVHLMAPEVQIADAVNARLRHVLQECLEEPIISTMHVPDRLRPMDSETTPIEDWESGVEAMIAQVKHRRASQSRER